MTQDEQEALSRAHGRDVIVVLPLKSGNIAVYNAKRELCGILESPTWYPPGEAIARIQLMWSPPTYQSAKPEVNLEELGLL